MTAANHHLPRRRVLLIDDDDVIAGGSVSLLAAIGLPQLLASTSVPTSVPTHLQSIVTVGELVTALPQFSSKGQPE